MKIIINDKETELPGHETIKINELLQLTDVSTPTVFVKVNGVMIKKTDLDACLVKDGDRVEAIPLVGGG